MFNKFFNTPEENKAIRNTPAEIVRLPALSRGIKKAKINKWHVKVGDTVNEGSLIAELESDKFIFEFDSYAKGTILYLGAEENTTLKIGETLLIIGNPGEDYAHLLNDD